MTWSTLLAHAPDPVPTRYRSVWRSSPAAVLGRALKTEILLRPRVRRRDGAARRPPRRSGLPRRVRADYGVYLPPGGVVDALMTFKLCTRCHWSVSLPTLRRAHCPRCSAPNQ